MTLERLSGEALARIFRTAYHVRRGEAAAKQRLARLVGRTTDQERRLSQAQAERAVGARARGPGPQRNVLFITVDQQRYDALRVNGGRVARTPNLDALAAEGINYRRAHVQNVVCMPSRSTMLTGQHPRTHGVIANGVPLPESAPSVARLLRSKAGYRTALIGKAHFDPHLDPTLSFFENRCAAAGETGPWHGFDHVEFATHGPVSGQHYSAWLWEHHPENIGGFGGVLTGRGGGDTSAPEVTHNPVPAEHYHTQWVADRTLAWLGSVPATEPWFCWMSFPDPHHPFDPPLDEVRARLDWRDVPLPDGYPGSPEQAAAILAGRPRHWLDWFRGDFRNPEGGPVNFVPARLARDQLREVNAMIHVENELIDDACGRVFSWLRTHGLDPHTDIFYTSDHGELQGDFGLLFKGPYHVDSLLRVPLIWRPAPSAGIAAAEIVTPVGHVDLAPSFCQAAGVDASHEMQGAALPTTTGDTRQRVITTFDSQFAQVGMHLRTIYRDGYLCTAYEATHPGSASRFPVYWSIWGRGSQLPRYSGLEGELYDCREDPRQWHNLWDDPSRRSLRDDLVADLHQHLPPSRVPPLRGASPT